MGATLSTSLLSVRKLNSKGFDVKFPTNGHCEINYNHKNIAAGYMQGNMYVLKQPNMACSIAQHSDECIHHWHRVCGHRDIEVVKKLVTDGFVIGAQIVDCGIRETCATCHEGKMTRLKFDKCAEKHSTKPMDLVHTDVCGPMPTETPSKKRYILTFIDDFSRYTCIYLLRNKSDVFDRLKDYIGMVSTMFGRKLKMIRSDRGGEYTGNESVVLG